MNAKAVAEYLQQRDKFLLITHTRPDGDTLGSGGALCCALRRMGKQAYLLKNEEATEKYLPYVGGYFAPVDYEYETVIAVDTADVTMFPKGFTGKVDLCIDHHGSNSGYAERTFVSPHTAACGELILEVIEALCGDVSKEEANLLYIAVSTDTGCFQYMNTNSDNVDDIVKYKDILKHVHISELQRVMPEDGYSDYVSAVLANLRAIGYEGTVSFESKNGDGVESMKKALKLLKNNL